MPFEKRGSKLHIFITSTRVVTFSFSIPVLQLLRVIDKTSLEEPSQLSAECPTPEKKFSLIGASKIPIAVTFPKLSDSMMIIGFLENCDAMESRHLISLKCRFLAQFPELFLKSIRTYRTIAYTNRTINKDFHVLGNELLASHKPYMQCQ